MLESSSSLLERSSLIHPLWRNLNQSSPTKILADIFIKFNIVISVHV